MEAPVFRTVHLFRMWMYHQSSAAACIFFFVAVPVSRIKLAVWKETHHAKLTIFAPTTLCAFQISQPRATRVIVLWDCEDHVVTKVH